MLRFADASADDSAAFVVLGALVVGAWLSGMAGKEAIGGDVGDDGVVVCGAAGTFVVAYARSLGRRVGEKVRWLRLGIVPIICGKETAKRSRLLLRPRPEGEHLGDVIHHEHRQLRPDSKALQGRYCRSGIGKGSFLAFFV